MINPLANIWNTDTYKTAGQTTPMLMGGPTQTDTETLPYGGGTYNPAGTSAIAPAPVFTGAPAAAPATPEAPTEPANDLYAKYRDPKTGEVMSPEEYAIYMGNKVPKGTGEVSNYAGNALANPDQTANQLRTQATNLNNSRNDIATGTTDPYKAGSQSGIAYSPAELKAIESAYAGIYDPALNDVFSRLQDKKTEDAKVQAREDRVFATNEAIRQWQATTGTKQTGDDSTKKIFTQTQLNNGSSNSGLSLESFTSLDDDIKNFYINPPKAMNGEDKLVPIYQNFEEDLLAVANGELDADTLVDEITNQTLPQSVKHYFVEQIPMDVEKKEGWFKRVWGAVTGN